MAIGNIYLVQVDSSCDAGLVSRTGAWGCGCAQWVPRVTWCWRRPMGQGWNGKHSALESGLVGTRLGVCVLGVYYLAGVWSTRVLTAAWGTLGWNAPRWGPGTTCTRSDLQAWNCLRSHQPSQDVCVCLY